MAAKEEAASQDQSSRKGKSGFFTKLLMVVMLPLAVFGAYSLIPVVRGVEQEVQGGGGWKKMYDSMIEKWNADGFEGVQEMLKDAPEMKTGVLLRKAILNDDQLKAQVKQAVVRLQSEGKLSAGEGRALIQRINEESPGDAE